MAFAIDRAVWTFGSCVESDMHEAENDPRLQKANTTREMLVAARQAVWDAYMNLPDGDTAKPAPPPAGRFADPASFVRSK